MGIRRLINQNGKNSTNVNFYMMWFNCGLVSNDNNLVPPFTHKCIIIMTTLKKNTVNL